MNIVIFVIFDFFFGLCFLLWCFFHCLLGFLCFLSLPISVWSRFGCVLWFYKPGFCSVSSFRHYIIDFLYWMAQPFCLCQKTKWQDKAMHGSSPACQIPNFLVRWVYKGMDHKCTFRVVVHLALCGNHKGWRLIFPIDLLDSLSRFNWRFRNVILIFRIYVFLHVCVSLCSFGQFHCCTDWFVCLSMCFSSFFLFFIFTSLLRHKPHLYLVVYFCGYKFNISHSLYGIIHFIIYF